MMTKVLTGVLSVGLLAVASGGVFAADSVDKQEVENKYFTQSEVQNGQKFYSYEYGDLEISSDRVLTEEGIEQVKIDNSEAESSPDIPVYESFTGTIHESNGQGSYSYEHGNIEISSDIALTEEEVKQIKIDSTEAESSPDIPVDESFKGTIHKKNNDHLKKSHNIKSGSSH